MDIPTAATLAFWSSAAIIVYVYVGYPLTAALAARWCGRSAHASENHRPTVTVVIAAHNEQESIARTIRNKLEQDYPGDKLDVVVVSDASNDRTDEIVSGFCDRVTLIRQSRRAGKTAALNRAIPEARGEIIVFSDANSLYSPTAISQLVRWFDDPGVGYVTGRMVYVHPDGSLVGDGCTAYMRYENWLREKESRFGYVIGVDGGIDAMRKALYTTLEPDQQSDFVLPLSVAGRGLRVIFEPEAEIREESLSDKGSEYRMRLRVTLRALWVLWDLRGLLNPFKYKLLSWQLWSHKLLRYLAWIPLCVALLASIVLARHSIFFAMLFSVQAGFYLLAVIGSVFDRKSSWLFTVPVYFCLINLASAHAMLRFTSGERQAIWAPRTG